jgi:hypothetical protein
MTTTTRIYYDEVTITKEEKDFLSAVYQMVLEIEDSVKHSDSVYNTETFSSMLDMIMSDMIDATEKDSDGDYVIDFTSYYVN